MVCMCHAVCPDATIAWVECYQRVMRARKSGEARTPKTLGSACDDLRHQLEKCTEYASARMLEVAVMPQGERNDGSFVAKFANADRD